MRKEEKGSTLARSLSSLEHHVSVIVERKTLHHILRRDVVQVHYPFKLLVLIALECRLELDVVLLVID